MIVYGINYGYQYNTPSGHFMMTPTDMNFNTYIQYEGKGVAPDIAFDFNKYWIAQTCEIIPKHSK